MYDKIISIVKRNEPIKYLNDVFDAKYIVYNRSDLKDLVEQIRSKGFSVKLYDSPIMNCLTLVIINSQFKYSKIFFLSRYLPIHMSILAPHDGQSVSNLTPPVLTFNKDVEDLFVKSLKSEKVLKESLSKKLEWSSFEDIQAHQSLHDYTYLQLLFNDERIEIKSVE